MRTLIATFLIFCAASSAHAQSCPDFFRFVDFGLKAPDGALYRGGPIFRAESLSGSPLLLRERTACLEVSEIAKDGHGNPIPVVSRIHYTPARTEIGLNALSISNLNDTKSAAEKTANDHRATLGQPGTKVTRGETFLCATREKDEISCQIISPYPVDAPLIITCGAIECRMPVLAIDARLAAQATWPSTRALMEEPAAIGGEITDMVRRIHDFLAPLTSGL